MITGMQVREFQFPHTAYPSYEKAHALVVRHFPRNPAYTLDLAHREEISTALTQARVQTPVDLIEALQKLPGTEDIVLVSGLTQTSHSNERHPLNFKMAALGSFAGLKTDLSVMEENRTLLGVDTVARSYHRSQKIHHDGGSDLAEVGFDAIDAILSLGCVNPGSDRSATQFLNLSSALSNPRFAGILFDAMPDLKHTNPELLRLSDIAKRPEYPDFYHSFYSLDPDDLSNWGKTSLPILLKAGQAVFTHNANLWHGGLSTGITRRLFPDTPDTEDQRLLVRCFFPLSERPKGVSLLQHFSNAAQNAADQPARG